jgi:hypothetical protein
MTSDWRRRLAEIVEEVGEDAVLEALNAPTSQEFAAVEEELAEHAAWRGRIDKELADLRRPPEWPPEIVRPVEAMIQRNRSLWVRVLELQEARRRSQKQAADEKRNAILKIANEMNAPRGRDLSQYVHDRMARGDVGCSTRTIRRRLKEARETGKLRP